MSVVEPPLITTSPSLTFALIVPTLSPAEKRLVPISLLIARAPCGLSVALMLLAVTDAPVLVMIALARLRRRIVIRRPATLADIDAPLLVLVTRRLRRTMLLPSRLKRTAPR